MDEGLCLGSVVHSIMLGIRENDTKMLSSCVQLFDEVDWRVRRFLGSNW